MRVSQSILCCSCSFHVIERRNATGIIFPNYCGKKIYFGLSKNRKQIWKYQQKFHFLASCKNTVSGSKTSLSYRRFVVALALFSLGVYQPIFAN